MTFTIVGRCERTGQTGIAMATSSPAVGNRCSFVSRAGSVAFQSVAEPRLGALGLRLLEQGFSAKKVVADLIATDYAPEKRQIGVIDVDGNCEAYTGAGNMDWCGHVVGKTYVAMGNVLAGPEVVQAIAEAYEDSAGEDLEQRLVLAIEAGRDAGGQEEGQTSASLITFGQETYSRCDLRVDISLEPVAELRRIYDWYRPLIPYFVERAFNAHVPRYKDFLAQNGHVREFGRRPPVTRKPRARRA
jgi:uncharacterized Ntn-hydrolase superfamily protein